MKKLEDIKELDPSAFEFYQTSWKNSGETWERKALKQEAWHQWFGDTRCCMKAVLVAGLALSLRLQHIPL